MASLPSTTQKASRWGTFLAGVESKLDTILADEDRPSSKPKPEATRQVQAGRKETLAPPSSHKAAGETISRPSSASRAQDRLNERLARAVATRNLNRMDDKSPATSSLPSRTASPANGKASPRSSTEVKREGAAGEEPWVSSDSAQKRDVSFELNEENEQQQSGATNAEAPAPQIDRSESRRLSLDSHRSTSARSSFDLPRSSVEASSSPKINGISTSAGTNTPPQYQQKIEQMRSDYEAAELRRQEETHIYLERIDALQSKLQYLTKEAAEIAKNAKSEAENGSVEEKLAAKDEKIALLMEEGHKLSQKELKHMSIIKKLRTQATDDDKRVAEMKRLSEKHEKAARDAQERARRAEEAEKRASEQARSLPRLAEDVETLRADRDAQDALIQDLQTQLAEATSAARQAEEEAHAAALEAKRKRTADLTDELSGVKTEKELAERQYQTELRELREKFEREKERARIAELERQGEQNILESRLEVYRARAEEASAGSGGDVQAKLLRQIETLQNQYAIASENWQGIEGSLLARAATLEKERDEIAKREADVRRKARETNMRLRRAEEELERVVAKTQDLEHEILQQRSQLTRIREKLARAEADAGAARKELIVEREAWEVKEARRLEGNRLRQQEDSFKTPDTLDQPFYTESPVTSGRKRKTSNADRVSPHNNPRLQGLAISGAERPLSRRSSAQPLNHSSDHQRSLSRQDSMSFVTHPTINGAIPETPSIQIDNRDDFFDGIRTPATPERTINDLISVSTAGAGPSVQLVERMSAAVRRLESEKAAHKDELARLSTQRDEAREQVVGLMKEAEEKGAADAEAKKLKEEVEELNARYLTTLEMLGEKSEKVDELMADVADLKEMYRELVDRTMK
ncbi:MAG: hypothetical protein LQ338_003022 [Usnochroma carphineum]|nr:MAG: hypothetical protein LQ338_003022 [Usnochroma carphineum]